MRCFWHLTFLFTSVISAVSAARREKVIGGKLNVFENVTRTVDTAVAMLFRNTVIIYGNQHLNVSYKLYDCEKSKGNVNGRTAVGQVAYGFTANVFGNAVGNYAYVVEGG